MEISAVNDWLGSVVKNYQTGVVLYKRFGTNDFLKSLFDKGENAYTRVKLAEELASLTPEVKCKAVAIPEKTIYPHEDYKNLPEEITMLVNQAKQIFKENATRQSELYSYYEFKSNRFNDGSIGFVNPKDQLHCAILSNTILDADDELTALFNKIDYYHKHKCLPVVTTGDINITDYTSAYEVELALQKTRQFISKNKNNPLKADLVKAKTELKIQLERRRNELV